MTQCKSSSQLASILAQDWATCDRNSRVRVTVTVRGSVKVSLGSEEEDTKPGNRLGQLREGPKHRARVVRPDLLEDVSLDLALLLRGEA